MPCLAGDLGAGSGGAQRDRAGAGRNVQPALAGLSVEGGDQRLMEIGGDLDDGS